MNSASVVGVAPEALHWRVVPHDPVWHVPLPLLSNLQPVRPHIRPLHPNGALRTIDWPDFKANPPPLKLSPGVIPGQIVSLHSFMSVKVLAPSVCLAPAEP